MMQFLAADKLTAIPELLFVLGVMVIVHEFGHFLAAKLCGVRVEAFAIGFGKRLFGFIHNGTDYRLNLLPLGGYVKMAGEMGPVESFDPPRNPNDSDPGELQNHPRWQRTLITIAGPLANFILAFVLMTAFNMAHNEVPTYLTEPARLDYVASGSAAARAGLQPGDRIINFEQTENPTWEESELRAHLSLNQPSPISVERNGQRIHSSILLENKGDSDDFDLESVGLYPVWQPGPVQIEALADDPNLPAARAGLKPGDRILTVDGHDFHSVTSVAAYLKDGDGKPVKLVIARGQSTLPVSVTPQQGLSRSGSKAWQIGFQATLPPITVAHYPLPRAASESWKFTKSNSLLLVEVLRRLFTRQVSVKTLSSPIGMGVQVHRAFGTRDWRPIIELMAIISLNLGIFNLLPIPILDGGTVMFLAIESLIRRDINPQLKERFYQVAFVCIVLFAAVVIFNDITKIAHHGG